MAVTAVYVVIRMDDDNNEPNVPIAGYHSLAQAGNHADQANEAWNNHSDGEEGNEDFVTEFDNELDMANTAYNPKYEVVKVDVFDDVTQYAGDFEGAMRLTNDIVRIADGFSRRQLKLTIKKLEEQLANT